MKKTVIISLLLIPLFLFAQEGSRDSAEKSKKTRHLVIPVQSKFADNFKIHKIYFNKRIDTKGQGEILEVEFILKNLTDNPQELYIFVIATCEKPPKELSSFDRPVKQKDKLRQFVPYPFDMKNFEYPLLTSYGKEVKNNKGETVMTYLKSPHNPKAGVSPYTDKPYKLNKQLVVRTYHLSPYRVNYTYFNHVTVIIFDNDGKPLYRQIWFLKGKRT